jgi:glutamyl-tRNA reductase
MATTLIQLGITDRTALAAARWAAGGEPALADALRRTAMTRLGVQPAVLSTCERLELYALVPSTGGSAFAEAAAHFTDIAGGGPIEIRLGQAAVQHLFSIAAGTESRLIGDTHVLGQVSRCIPMQGRANEPSDTPLLAASGTMRRLVQDAVACGRSARAASGLDRLAVSCVDLAVAHAFTHAAPGSDAAVIGSGALARELAPRLAGAGFRVTVFSRHAPAPGGGPLGELAWAPLVSLRERAARLSLLVAATSATTPIVSAEDIGRRDAWLDMIDLGMPANLSADLARSPFVRIATLDTLLEGRHSPREVVESTRAIVQARAARWSRRWLGSTANRLQNTPHRSHAR